MFNGAYVGLGNIAKLSQAVTRSITAENVYGEKGRGGMAEVSAAPQAEVIKLGQKVGRRESLRAGPGPEVEGAALHHAAQGIHDAPHGRRRARGHPAHLDDGGPEALPRPDPADVLGRRSDSERRGAARRLFLQRLEDAGQRPVHPDQRQPVRGQQLLFPHAVPPARADHDRESRARRPDRLLLCVSTMR